MARKLSTRQQEQRDYERGLSVYKNNSMIQKGRHDLTVREQKAVIYSVSKIKETDTAFDWITFELKDFCAVCGFEMDSYTEIKASLQKLRDRSWWATIDDRGTESTISWFSKVRTNKKDGKVMVKFDEDMMPYLLELVKNGRMYTAYDLRYILPMNSQYGIRLYELLKSYSNNTYWWFEVSELKHRLNAENYKNFNDFKRFALEPAVEDINTYSDLTVSYKAEKEGRSYTRITFYIKEKSNVDLTVLRIKNDMELDGE